MKDYYEKATRALQLAGLSQSTIDCYTRSIWQLVKFYGKTPDLICETELEDYFLHRQKQDNWAPATIRIAIAGIRFFFKNVLKRDWHVFNYIKAKRPKELPCILSKEEVFKVLNAVKTFHNYVFFSTVYSCGLRLSEGLGLESSDIDSQRNMIHVHRGKGAKDRFVPLAQSTLKLLRRYWLTHKHKKFIFPAIGRGGDKASTALRPMNKSSVQSVFKQSRIAAGINKRRVTIHTLRHCYATHLLEAGVNPRIVQRYMGHSQLETTMIYLHLTQKGTEDAYEIINSEMRGFNHANN